jgi:hypothetical protein
VLGWTAPLWDHMSKLTSAERLVLVAYAAGAGPRNGWTFAPTLDALERHTGYKRRQLIYARNRLVDLGLLVPAGTVPTRLGPVPRFAVPSARSAAR